MGSLLTTLGLVLGPLLVASCPGQHSIAGRVRLADRSGAAQAEVTVRWRAHPELPGLLGWSLEGGGAATARAVADARGHWQLTVPVRGPFEVGARRADGGAVSEPEYGVMAGGFVDQVLGAPFLVSGRVRREDGAPLAGQIVLVEPGRTTWSRLAWYGLPPTRGAVSADGDGRFRLELARGYLHHPFWEPFLSPSLADPRRALQRDVLLRPTPGCRELELVVTAPELVVGTVVGPVGEPVGGAEVRERNAPWRRQVTGPDGRFTVDRRALPGLMATAPGLAPDLDGARPADPDAAPELRLGPTWPVAMLLRDPAGVALADREVLWVTLLKDEPVLEVRARTDAQGRATVRAGAVPLLGFVRLGDGFAPFTQLVPQAAVQREVIVAARRVRAAVVSAAGTPVARARVVARARGDLPPEAPECCWVTYTDHGGRCEFVALPPGPVQLFCAAGVQGLGTAALPDGAEDAELRLPAGGTAEVEVFGVDGETGVAGAWVTLARDGGGARGSISGPASSMTTVVGFTDADGRVRFTGLPEGQWSVITNQLSERGFFGGGASVVTDGDPARVVLRPMRE